MMFGAECLSVNANGHLEIGGAEILSIATKYGTPLYIMDENQIRRNCRAFKKALTESFGMHCQVLFASKAFCTGAMYKILKEEGLGADVVSGGELYTALKAGFSPSQIYFHGNNKTREELKFAVDNDVARIVVDNREELKTLNKIASDRGKIVKILFRIKPGVDAHTHDFIKTGQIDSKFGVAIENGEAVEIIKESLKLDNVKLTGLHCHIGSQIFESEPYFEAARVMMEFIAKIRDELAFEMDELNLGGGFGIRYTEDDHPCAIERQIQAAARAIQETAQKHNLKIPKVLIEPGRSIVGPAGVTVYTVGAVKTIQDVRTYVMVDGSMCDNPRYALYGARYDVLSALRPKGEKNLLCTVAGKCCESGDLIAKDIWTQDVSPGEYVCVLATGAYNYSMASNYNRNPRPAVVMVKDSAPRLVVRRETYEDLIRNDLFNNR